MLVYHMIIIIAGDPTRADIRKKKMILASTLELVQNLN